VVTLGLITVAQCNPGVIIIIIIIIITSYYCKCKDYSDTVMKKKLYRGTVQNKSE